MCELHTETGAKYPSVKTARFSRVCVLEVKNQVECKCSVCLFVETEDLELFYIRSQPATKKADQVSSSSYETYLRFRAMVAIV